MTMVLSESDIKSAICGLTEVVKTNQGYEVSVPQIYHSGHGVTVVVSHEINGFVVHDNSYAAMLLASMGIAAGKRLADALRPQVVTYGCDLDDLRVFRRCETVEQLGVTITLVGCASRLVADQALKADRPPLHDFKSSLASKVLSVVGSRRIRTNEEVTGHLGSKYRVSTVVLDQHESKAVAFVEPLADRESVARRFKQFYDLSRTPALEAVDRIAVYDEENPIPQSDALLLQEVGNIVRFSDTTQRLRAWATIQ